MIIAFIEAIAGSHMHSIAAAHGNLHEVNMPKPDAIYLRGLAYAAFITHQKMSSRGGYSALCGDLPRLLAGIAKMTGIASGQEKPCLASVLRDHGYMTLFTKEEDSDYM